MKTLFFIINTTLVLLISSQWDSIEYDEIISNDHNSKLNWGTYKPNLYFSIRERKNTSLIFGMMWYGADLSEYAKQGNITDRIRHECNMKDDLTYYWNTHNGVDIADQIIKDKINNLELNTQFIKEDSNTWYSIIKGIRTIKSSPVSLILYTSLENYLIEEKSILSLLEPNQNDTNYLIFTIKHKEKEENNGFIQYKIKKSQLDSYSIQKLRKKYEETWRIKSFISEELKSNELNLLSGKSMYIDDVEKNYSRFSNTKKLNSPNIIAIQLVFVSNFQVEVIYSNNMQKPTDTNIAELANKRINEFDNRFSLFYKAKLDNLSFITNDSDRNSINKMMKQAVSNIFWRNRILLWKSKDSF